MLEALDKAQQVVKKAWAMGPGCMSEGTILRDNIGWGEDALKFIQSDSADHGHSQGQEWFHLGVTHLDLQLLRIEEARWGAMLRRP